MHARGPRVDASTTDTARMTTKLFIPVSDAKEDTVLCGLLEQLAPLEPTRGRKLALIVHGHIGHKDYLYQRQLALRLPIDSFRFDFRGCNESTGCWNFGHLPDDVEDIRAVVAFLTSQHGYVIHLVVAHSRGSITAMHWMCTSAEGKGVTGFVNLSARYLKSGEAEFVTPAQRKILSCQASDVGAARKPYQERIASLDYDDFTPFDCSSVWDLFPSQTHVLTLHGLKDAMISPHDAIIYARALGARHPGTHNLHYVEEGDHNFTGCFDHVMDVILEWFTHLEKTQLQTGVWRTGVRGKL